METRSSKNILKLAAGDLIDGRFKINSNPLRRSFGIAYLVLDVNSQAQRTLLFISPAIYHDAEAMEYIRDETKLIRWLDHPHIARLYELHSEGEYAYFELEYVRGRSLKEKKVAAKQKRLSENVVKWLGIQILEALEYAHDQNIIHRDIRPQNVMLTPDGKVKLIDFGISETLRASVSMVWDTTAQTTILYMSPEQLQGKQIGVQADVYSVAATMYDLASGKPPFFYGDVYTQILRKEAQAVEGISEGLNKILLKALSKDPAQRYASARAMKTDLMRSGVHYQPSATIVEKAKLLDKHKKKTRKKGFAFFSLNPTLKIMFWSILLVALLVLVLREYKQVRSLGSLVDTLKVHQTADSMQIKLSQALLKAGNDKLAAGQLFEPSGNNALELFIKVLKNYPDNEEALAKIANIKKALLKRIKEKLAKGETAGARNLLDRASHFFPQDPSFKALQNKAPRFTLKLVILNGSGKKGIAHRLAAKLRNLGITVVKVDNYKKNGRPYWRVAKTKFYGSISANKRIHKMASNLGLPYRKIKNKNLFGSAGNLIIILGKDYARLNSFFK